MVRVDKCTTNGICALEPLDDGVSCYISNEKLPLGVCLSGTCQAALCTQSGPALECSNFPRWSIPTFDYISKLDIIGIFVTRSIVYTYT